jgi:CBS domain containing-hemolysin-like protein
VLVIIVVTTILIGLAALYVAAEFATVSARRARISQQAAEGNALARRLMPILDNPHQLDNYVAACQIGITITSLVLGFYGQSAIATAITPWLSRLGGLQEMTAQSLAATVVLIALTALQVLLSELVPKSVALRYPEWLALLTFWPMHWSILLFRPAIILFNGAGTLILRLLGVPPAGHQAHVHSPEELSLLIGESTKGGLLEADERQLLDNALRVSDLTTAQIMVPRTRMAAAPINTSVQELLKLITNTGYTRIPVYDRTIDNILGIVHLKDLFKLYVSGQNQVASVIRTVPFVPESKPAVALWHQLRQEQYYMAIVFDEFGGTAGMITIEDLLEEIFGEFQDESDQELPLVATGPDGIIRLHGEFLVIDLNQRFGLNLPVNNSHTIGGLLLNTLGRAPAVGDAVTIAGTTLQVERVSGLAIREASLKLPPGSKPASLRPEEQVYE